MHFEATKPYTAQEIPGTWSINYSLPSSSESDSTDNNFGSSNCFDHAPTCASVLGLKENGSGDFNGEVGLVNWFVNTDGQLVVSVPDNALVITRYGAATGFEELLVESRPVGKEDSYFTYGLGFKRDVPLDQERVEALKQSTLSHNFVVSDPDARLLLEQNGLNWGFSLSWMVD